MDGPAFLTLTRLIGPNSTSTEMGSPASRGSRAGRPTDCGLVTRLDRGDSCGGVGPAEALEIDPTGSNQCIDPVLEVTR